MHSLILNGICIDIHSTHVLAKVRWRALQQLGLSACGIDVSCLQSLQSLVSGQWPMLSHVDLSHDGLDSQSYKVLLQSAGPEEAKPFGATDSSD